VRPLSVDALKRYVLATGVKGHHGDMALAIDFEGVNIVRRFGENLPLALWK
jgi:hypothetical protein